FAGASAMLVSAQGRPLPDQEAFLREVRKHLQTDASLQSRYVYTETRRQQKLDGDGRVTEERLTVLESYPPLPGERERWERVLVEDGEPVPQKTLEARDRERQRKAEELARRRAREPEQEYARQLRAYEKYLEEHTKRVEDIFRVY